jgi:branched-chain amino acid aminotransferase
MRLPDSAEELTESLVALLRAELFREDCYARPLAFYGDESIGVRLHNLTPELSIVALPYGKYVENEEGVHATISSWRRVDDNMIPARGKITGSYVNSAFAKTDAQRAGFDEAIMLNQDGHVAEGSAENFFIVKNGAVATPPVTTTCSRASRAARSSSCCATAWRARRRAPDRSHRDHARGRGVLLRHGRADRRDHARRSPAIGTGRMGDVVGALRALYFDVVRGRKPEYRRWCHPVYGDAPAASEKTPSKTSTRA